MVFLLERLCTLATLAGRLEQCMTARRNCFCAKPMDFALTFFFSSPPPSWKNYSSYELPALGSGPPRFTDGTKLSWVRGPIWKFSSPGCAWLGANNSPSHLRTGEDYFPPPPLSLFLSPTLGSEPVLSLGFSDLQEKKYRKKNWRTVPLDYSETRNISLLL